MNRRDLLKFSKMLLIFTLSLEIGFGPFVSSLAHGSSNSSPISESNFNLDEYLVNGLSPDPIYKAIAGVNIKDYLPPKIKMGDAGLDQDPYFKRAQSWAPGNTPVKGGIFVEAVNKTWIVDKPIKPILQTDDYIIFVAKKEFQDFKNLSPGEEESQGLFFASRDELLQSSMRNAPTPIYFFPLPGRNWIEDVEALDFPQLGVFALVGQDKTNLPIEIKDLVEIHEYQSQIHRLAAIKTFANHRMRADQLPDLTYIPIDPYLTWGFGFIFSGLDGSNSPNFSKIWNFIKSNLGIQRAEAVELKDFAQQFVNDPKIQAKGVRLLHVMGAALIVSVIIKYSFLRKKFSERRLQEALDGKPRNTVGKIIAGAAKDIGDTFAHTTTAMYQTPFVWGGNLLEFYLDRWAPGVFSGSNSYTRQALNNFYLFTRDSAHQTPVDLRMWFNGAILVGQIDTFFVAIQAYYVNENLAYAIAEAFPGEKERVLKAFDVNNENAAQIRLNMILTNELVSFQRGAADFAQGITELFMQKVQEDVDAELRSHGIDPKDPSKQNIRTALYNKRMHQCYKLVGLPGPEQFLFDTGTVYAKAKALFGYSVPTSLDEKPGNFAGFKRPALIIPSLDESVNVLRKRLTQKSAPGTMEALELLEEAQKRAHYITSVTLAMEEVAKMRKENPRLSIWDSIKLSLNSLQDPTGKKFLITLLKSTWTGLMSPLKEFSQALNEMKEQLVVLTQGDLLAAATSGQTEKYSTALSDRYVPRLWKNASREAIVIAAQTYSEVYGNYLRGPVKTEKPYIPPGRDLYGQWQLARIFNRASEKYVSKYKKSFLDLVQQNQKDEDINQKNEDIQNWQTLYKDVYMNFFGITEDYEGVPSGIDEKILGNATRSLTHHLTDKAVMSYIGALTPEKRRLAISEMYAQFYVNAYVNEFTTSTEIPATVVGQPGIFQWARRIVDRPLQGKAPLLSKEISARQVLVNPVIRATGQVGHFLNIRDSQSTSTDNQSGTGLMAGIKGKITSAKNKTSEALSAATARVLPSSWMEYIQNKIHEISREKEAKEISSKGGTSKNAESNELAQFGEELRLPEKPKGAWLDKTIVVRDLPGALSNRILRVAESFWAPSGYGPGIKEAFFRKVPMASDFRIGSWNTLKRFLPLATFMVPYNWFIFHQYWSDPAVYIWNNITMGVGLTALIRVTNRLFTNQGIQPMGGLLATILFGVTFTWMTFPAGTFNQYYFNDGYELIQNYLTQPVGDTLRYAADGFSNAVAPAMDAAHKNLGMYKENLRQCGEALKLLINR